MARLVPSSRPLEFSPLFGSKLDGDGNQRSTKRSTLKRVVARFDTVEAAGLEDVKLSGIIDRIKKLHNPKTYLALSLMAGLRWQWCFRNPYYWFAVAFCIKWYRARYVFKIPVWDRQPNWNNIITSKEQEKDLKAFTCLNCGSTIFIAKTREFFFEGDTGIGGLGCFACGAKGKDNFVMDRDRIVEDVADEDDYFEYERPLDFVSRAERRALLKEAGGDEEKANELLMNRSTSEQDTVAPPTNEQEVKGDSPDVSAEEVVDVEVESKEKSAETTELENGKPTETLPKLEVKEEESPKPKKKKKKKTTDPKKAAAKKSPPPAADAEDLDVLDMDAF